MRLANSMVSLIVSVRLARQAQDEGAVDLDAQIVAILGEALGHFDAHALLDVVQDLLVAALVADEQQAQAAILQHFSSVLRGTLALALHDQVTPSLPSSLAMASARGSIVGEGVVVEEEFLDLREGLFRLFDLFDHVLDAARAIVCPPTVCGHRQKVQRDLQPRPV